MNYNNNMYVENFGYRRNKRDIEEIIKYNNKEYKFDKILPNSNNKALLYRNNNIVLLVSYNTVVAQVIENNNITCFGYYSSTTARHINEFFGMYNISSKSKKELENISQNKIYLHL